jgi:hypothetical protein
MATKKITDLQLRSEFSATCNLPVDDTIQSYRCTGEQLYDFMRTFVFVDAYQATKSYSENDFCTYLGEIYKSLENTNSGNTPSSSPTKWLGSKPTSQISCDTGNATHHHGTTQRKIRRFTNNTVVGLDITYTQDATGANGDTFTINRNGIYTISYSDYYSGGGQLIGISKNATSYLDTNIDIVTPAQGRLIASYTPAVYAETNVCISVRLSAGDVIRAHDQSQCDAANRCQFVITQVTVL